MTNKAEVIIAALKTKLAGTGLKLLSYPDDINKFGNNYPYLIIKEGSKEFQPARGNRYEYVLEIILVIVGAYGNNRIKHMNELQKKVYDALFQNANLSGLAMNVNPISVETGEIMRGSDISAFAGHNEAVSFREITIQFRVQDARR